MKKFLILFLLICSPVLAQDAFGTFTDFGSNFADGIYTDVRFFAGETSVLGASDITVQLSLQTLNAFLATDNLVSVLCGEGKINCIYDTLGDCPDNNRCFVYNQNDEQLIVYVNNTVQMKWPQLPAAVNYLLLETGDKLLLEDSATDAILLE